MGDMGDVFKAMSESGKEKRWKNLESSTQILKEKGIDFQSFNNGIHLKVGSFDFWPSTGKFISKDKTITGRGVFNLIKILKGIKND